MEERNIIKIAKLCSIQESNWKENRSFIDEEMTKLYENEFNYQKELTAVTDILPGGVSGELVKRKTGQRKDKGQ